MAYIHIVKTSGFTPTLDKAITQLVKGQILIREDKGIYIFNPYLFGKGSWQTIQEIRTQITYNLQGRTFTSVNFKTIDGEEMQVINKMENKPY